MKTISASLVLASLLGVAATAVAAEPAPKAEATKAEAPAAPSAEAVAAGKKIDWATMDEKAKKKYMKTTVLPMMKKLFVAVDKKHYAAMNCATCHGKKAVESNKLKMPSAELPKLPGPTDRAGFMALQEKKPDVVKFMGTQVKPTMAALLGKAEWSETNPTGFGCYGCHTKDETAAAPPPPPGPPGGKPGATTPPGPGKPAAAPVPGGW